MINKAYIESKFNFQLVSPNMDVFSSTNDSHPFNYN